MNSIFKPNREISKVRQLTVTAMMGAVSTVLMFFEFSLPMIIPGYIKFDLSDLPALIASFAVGPLSGVGVCLIKCLINLPNSYSAGVGELSNFLLGCAFVIPAGLIYKSKKNKTRAVIGALTGAASMAVLSVITNYFVVYPAYSSIGIMSMEAIIDSYRAINPKVETLLDALIWFNMPFTFAKGLCSTLITVATYKYISPVLKSAGWGRISKKSA